MIKLDFENLEENYSSNYKYLESIDFNFYEDIDYLKTVFHKSLDHSLFIITLKSFERMMQLLNEDQILDLIYFISDVFNIVSVESDNMDEIANAANLASDIEAAFDMDIWVGNEHGEVSKSIIAISNRAFDDLKDSHYLEFAIKVMEESLLYRKNRNQTEEKEIFQDEIELASLLIKNRQFLIAKNILIGAIEFFEVQKRKGIHLETAQNLLISLQKN